jgi:hypothetical protein
MNEDKCLATVVFNDGEVCSYVVAANQGIAGHLMAEAGKHGILYMRGEVESYSIPVRNTREWKISALVR